jgi:hypothetical protein
MKVAVLDQQAGIVEVLGEPVSFGPRIELDEAEFVIAAEVPGGPVGLSTRKERERVAREKFADKMSSDGYELDNGYVVAAPDTDVGGAIVIRDFDGDHVETLELDDPQWSQYAVLFGNVVADFVDAGKEEGNEIEPSEGRLAVRDRAVVVKGSDLCVGDKVRWTRNDADLGLMNGDRVTVLGVDERQEEVLVEEGG